MADSFVLTEQNNTFLVCDVPVRLKPGEYTRGRIDAVLEGAFEALRHHVTYKMHVVRINGREVACGCNQPDRDHQPRSRPRRREKLPRARG